MITEHNIEANNNDRIGINREKTCMDCCVFYTFNIFLIIISIVLYLFIGLLIVYVVFTSARPPGMEARIPDSTNFS
jgi:hypothetical protein